MTFLNISGARPRDFADEKESITESLYKQNLELAVKNKTLSLLRQLYQISIQALDPATLAAKVSTTVRETLELELVGIFISEDSNGAILPLSLSYSDRLQKSAGDSGITLQCVISDSTKNSFLRPIFVDKMPTHAKFFGELWDNCVGKELMISLASSGHVKTTSGHPLIIDGKVMGVLIFCLNREYESLSKYEQESILSLVDVVAIALDKARLYQDLDQANKKQEGLIHFISHEIKGFLGKNEAAFAGLVEGDYGPVTAEAKELAEAALADTRKGVVTVMDILNASNLKKGTTKFDLKPFDITQVALDMIRDQAKAAEAKSLVLDVDVEKHTIMINGDAKEIGDHVMRNLIDNAIKYTPEGSIKISLKKINGKVVFSVKDSGIGITDEDKKKLFTEGGRGKESIKTNVNSTGYGLFIAKQIVDAHKGRIWAESEGQGKGSTFLVELPA